MLVISISKEQIKYKMNGTPKTSKGVFAKSNSTALFGASASVS
jgi:hypothetical protein